MSKQVIRYYNSFITDIIRTPVGYKKLDPEAKEPSYAHETDACLDFYALSDYEVISVPNSHAYLEYRTGIAIAIPAGHVGLVFPRSSISDTILSLSNAVGVIDSGYTGEIKFRFKIHEIPESQGGKVYEKGDRIGQLMIIPVPKISLNEVKELPQSDRGNNGHGSTGA